jgi:triacylglycerol lipase
VILFLVLMAHALMARAENDHPIVLLHGFTGWGPEEMGGFLYWGGNNSIAHMLEEAGHETYTGVVGPVASNWDRACELYAYIRGGRVDYGAVHAETHGHERYGRTFQGLIPDWGEPGRNQKVHLVGHSQGGQTSRVLTHLLKYGDPAEQKATPAEDTSPLFRGGHNWVYSVTTLATPHDGTPLVTFIDEYAPFIVDLVLRMAQFNSNSVAKKERKNGTSGHMYDFKLDQWDLARMADEPLKEYVRRVSNSDVWKTMDISVRDLSPEGALLLNQRFPVVDDVYYFSWSTKATYASPITGKHLPKPSMFPAFWWPATSIGRFTQSTPISIDDRWWPNDGLVSTVSSRGPTLGTDDPLIDWVEGTPLLPGRWHHMGVMEDWDHMDIVGQGILVKEFRSFYEQLGHMLQTLPPQEASGMATR